MQAISNYLQSSSRSSLTKDAIVLASTLYFLNKLRGVKLSALVKAVPGAQKLVSQQIESETSKAAAEMFPTALTTNQTLTIPKDGRSNADILADMKSYQKFDANGHDGKTFAYIYDTTLDGHHELIEKVFTTFMHENGLNPVAFPALRKFEVEVVSMTLNMLNAPSSACGTMTSGGTESLLCALKAYRERARVLYPHITQPEVVLPVSAHVAFPKGCALFDLKTVYVPLAADYGVDVAAYRRAITPNTILLVASAPQYPHGIVDPISQISDIAIEKKLPFHVDSCIGGFILPWVEKLGYPVPLWDYRVPGVTSISADVHKYGFAAKGASVLTWRHQSDRRHQFFAFSEWPGGLFISPSMLGTRPGGSIAAAWASLVSLGEAGFMRLTEKTMIASKAIQKGINEIPGLRVLGNPHMTIVAFESTDPSLNILALADIMDTPKFGGYHLERQQRPLCCHLTLMPPHAATLTDFLKQLAAACQYVRLHPELNKAGAAAMYGLVAKIGDGVIVEDFLTSFIGKVYSTPAAASSSSGAPPTDPKESKSA